MSSGESETLPLDSIEEVLAWKYRGGGGDEQVQLREREEKRWILSESKDGDGVACFDFAQEESTDPPPRVLLCHDMKGGYLEDRFVHGCYDCLQQPYRFVHWPLIDSFVYFSHHFVTVPPFGWIRAAHLNGVPVLGTLIVEDQSRGKALCDNLLATEESVHQFVAKLCEIAAKLRFEGWLLNVETDLDGAQVAKVVLLAERLTKGMRAVSGRSQVIWYDAVTIGGKLQWQNELNPQNLEFFKVTDGIFINYGWKVDEDGDNVDRSLETLRKFGLSQRRQQIYFGIDAFGRGTFGGGGFNCNVALEAVDGRTSVALFAPCWTHEAKDNDGDGFLCRDYWFWQLMEKRLGVKMLRLNVNVPTNVEFQSGSGKLEEDMRWWLDLERQRVMPPKYTYPAIPKTFDHGENDPFVLFHVQDIDGMPEKSGLFVAATAPLRPWKFFGYWNALPLLLCSLDLTALKILTVNLDASASFSQLVILYSDEEYITRHEKLAPSDHDDQNIFRFNIPAGAKSLRGIAIIIPSASVQQRAIIVRKVGMEGTHTP